MATVFDPSGTTAALINQQTQLANAGINTMQQFNPQMMAAKAKLDGLEMQTKLNALSLQQQQFEFTKSQAEIDNEMKKQQLDLSKYDIYSKIELAQKQNQLAKDQLLQQQAQFQSELSYKYDNLDLQKASLDLQREDSESNRVYKDAIVKQISYSMSQDNPDNILKMAQAASAFNPSAESPQGKLALDMKKGIVTPELLSQMQTTYDPTTGQQVTTFNQGQSGQPGLQKEAVVDMQKKDNEALSTIRAEAKAAIGELASYANLESAIDKFGTTAPVYGKAKLLASQVGAAIGIPAAERTAAAGEQLRSAGNLLALVNRKDLPGAMSDADRQFLLQSAPGLSNTEKGNRLLLETAKAKATLTTMYADFAESYRSKTGSLSGLSGAWQKYVNSHPLIDPEKGSIRQPDKTSLAKFVSDLPTQADLLTTARKYNMTVEEVKAKLGY